MANTVITASAMRKQSSPGFMKICPSGEVEPIMGSKKNGNGKFSPAITRRIEELRPNYEKLGAGDVYEHQLSVLRAAARGGLIDPHADESDWLTMEVTDQALCHSHVSDSYLPTDVEFSKRFHAVFELRRMLSSLNTRGGDRCSEYIQLLNDPSIDPTDLLIAIRTQIADMMTIHDPSTVIAAKTNMPGVFPVHERGWEEVLSNLADPMLKVYCPIADWGGHTHAYGLMRDNAMYYRYPRRYQKVALEVQKRGGALENTERFLLKVLKEMSKQLDLKIIVASDYSTVSKVFSELGPNTVVVALKPPKGKGGLLYKSMKTGFPLENIHDWAGLTVITATEEQVYTVVSFLYEKGIREAAAAVGAPDIYINKPQDYGANPKPTGYQMVHIDTMMSCQDIIVPTEFKVCTLEWHMKAYKGSANHRSYKGSPLANGECDRFMSKLKEITSCD